MFTSLQTLKTHCLHFQYDVANVPSHTEHVKRSLETSKIEKKAKSTDLVVLRLSQREKIEKSHYLTGESIFFKILSTPFLSTWLQTCWTPARSNVVLVRRTYDFWFFFCWFSGFAAITKKKVEKCHISINNHFYSNYFTNICLSTWMQTFLSPARSNVVLVRRTYDFLCFFWNHRS